MSIYLPVIKLSPWGQKAFSAALVERMLPNYALFSEGTGFGDVSVLRNQLDLVWQHLGPSKVKINVDVQLEKLEEQIPEVDNFEGFGVYPALDTCMAMTALLSTLNQPPEEYATQVSQLSANTVISYLELLLEQEEPDVEITEAMINEQPLMQWEKATQNELFDLLKEAKESLDTIKLLKAKALEEGVSNLGIEIV